MSEAITSIARSQTRCRPTTCASASVNDLFTLSATSTPGASSAMPAAMSAAVPSPHAAIGLQCRNAYCNITISVMSWLGVAPRRWTDRACCEVA
jgi:hypothetical protein